MIPLTDQSAHVGVILFEDTGDRLIFDSLFILKVVLPKKWTLSPLRFLIRAFYEQFLNPSRSSPHNRQSFSFMYRFVTIRNTEHNIMDIMVKSQL